VSKGARSQPIGRDLVKRVDENGFSNHVVNERDDEKCSGVQVVLREGWKPFQRPRV
jgi:hypothetical protein